MKTFSGPMQCLVSFSFNNFKSFLFHLDGSKANPIRDIPPAEPLYGLKPAHLNLIFTVVLSVTALETPLTSSDTRVILNVQR